MTDYFDHLTFGDRQFILWVKSPEFSYDYVLCLNDWQPPFEIFSKQEFFKLLEGIADEITSDIDNYDNSGIEVTFAGNREEPPEYGRVFDVPPPGCGSFEDPGHRAQPDAAV